MRASAAPSATPGPKRCWSRWAWVISSETAPTSFPAASSSVFPLPGHWCGTRRSFWPTSLPVQADRIIRLEDGRVVYDGDSHAPEAIVQPTLLPDLPDEEEKA